MTIRARGQTATADVLFKVEYVGDIKKKPG
jgi:hypothetical protein